MVILSKDLVANLTFLKLSPPQAVIVVDSDSLQDSFDFSLLFSRPVSSSLTHITSSLAEGG